MKVTTDMGYIEIANDVIAAISGYAASNCFGVKGMAVRNMADGLVNLVKPDAMTRGVKVTVEDDAVVLELHMAMEHGVNLVTVGHSVMDEVRFVVEHYTGARVKSIDIYVDSVVVE